MKIGNMARSISVQLIFESVVYCGGDSCAFANEPMDEFVKFNFAVFMW